jgi:DNA transposition AAA+ family ATPase
VYLDMNHPAPGFHALAVISDIAADAFYRQKGRKLKFIYNDRKFITREITAARTFPND